MKSTKKKLQERGSITLFVLITMMALLIIIVGTYVSSNNLSKKLGRIIICSYNTMDGKSVIANSEPTVKKIEKFYNKGEYKVVDVYINPENNWDYYVDINSIKR